jgi:hypothetical protein
MGRKRPNIADGGDRKKSARYTAKAHAMLPPTVGQAYYVRHDETTATRLLALASKLINDYGGKLSDIVKASADRQAFEKRQSEFARIGPKTIEIFMREAGAVLY